MREETTKLIQQRGFAGVKFSAELLTSPDHLKLLKTTKAYVVDKDLYHGWDNCVCFAVQRAYQALLENNELQHRIGHYQLVSDLLTVIDKAVRHMGASTVAMALERMCDKKGLPHPSGGQVQEYRHHLLDMLIAEVEANQGTSNA